MKPAVLDLQKDVIYHGTALYSKCCFIHKKDRHFMCVIRTAMLATYMCNSQYQGSEETLSVS